MLQPAPNRTVSGGEVVFCVLCFVCGSALRRLRGCEVQSSELNEILEEQADTKGHEAQTALGAVLWSLCPLAAHLCHGHQQRHAALWQRLGENPSIKQYKYIKHRS